MDEASDDAGWVRPDDVMKMHKIKMRQKQLQARINKQSIDGNISGLNTSGQSSSAITTASSQKRKNPFIKDGTSKKVKENNAKTIPELEASSDSVLFELMKGKTLKKDTENDGSTFNSLLDNSNIVDDTVNVNIVKSIPYVPLDWTLNTKMRFMSIKPFCWNCKLKISEQASGTTGFVRCLNIGEQETTLDTSPNARFHQCCLIWQHPSIPWLELFPRTAGKISADLASNSAISNNQFIKESLFTEWSDSFRSLFHLLRARQCPYFYVCANTFTALFRAAGICGVSEMHVLLTPTTTGFRKLLKEADIEYTMPLKPVNKRRSDMNDSSETLDSTSSNIAPTSDDVKKEYLSGDDDDEDDDDDDPLKSLGIDEKLIKKIKNQQDKLIFDKESEVDRLKQSLVFIKGVEAQALFNFLKNCKSAVATNGALGGVPPTLLAPVAYHGATLKSLKVRESVVRRDNEKFYSLEIKGPILPHVLPSLCHLMKSSHLEEFSVTCAQLSSTNSFSIAKNNLESPKDIKEVPKSVFGQENLTDCGFTPELLSHFCHPDPTRIQIVESLKFSNDGYTFS